MEGVRRAVRDAAGAIVRWAAAFRCAAVVSEREEAIIEATQRALLPRQLPDVPGLVFDVAYRPATDGVGGDFYDAFTLADGTVCIAICDIAGRGFDAAAAMSQVRETIRVAAFSEGGRPDVVLRRANRGLFLNGMDVIVTAMFATIDPQTHAVTYAIAGHPPPLVVSRDGAVRALEGGGVPLGIDEEFQPAARSGQLASGDRLVVYTDGLIRHERDVVAGETVLHAALRELAGDATPGRANALVERLVPRERRDDVAVLSIFVEGAPRSEYDEVFTATGPSAAIARGALRGFLVLDGVRSQHIDDAVTAAGEAIANAIEHAYERIPGTFRLRASTYDDRVVVEVQDDGRWRAPSENTLFDAASGVMRLSERGRGLFLVRALTQHASVERTPAGTRVSFVVSR